MKGIDIVVHGTIGHMSAFMAQSGNLVVLGDAGEALGDCLYEARLFVRGKVKSLGADCIEKGCAGASRCSRACSSAQAASKARPEEFRRYGSARKLYNFNIDNVGRRTESTANERTADRPAPRRASPPPSIAYTLSEIRRAAATGIYDIRGGGAKRKLPHFDDLLFLGASISPLSAGRLSREMRDRCRARHALCEEADPSGDPDHHRGHELRRAVRPRQGGAGARRDCRWAPRPPPATAA